MEFRYAISFVLEAHLPFVREYSKDSELSHLGNEVLFFEYISETLIPLLETLHRLETDHVHFKLGLAVSPTLFQMLSDELLQKKYLVYIDKQIEFGKQELIRTADNSELNKLAQIYCDKIIDRRITYTERYEQNILKAFDFYRRKGKVEILGSCATHTFMPFLGHNAESLQAQMETPISGYRQHFGSPQGFWIPYLGWTPAIEPYLRAYNYTYTIIENHGLLLGTPAPEKGCFFPVKTPNGTFILARDLYAVREIEKAAADEKYRNNNIDVGYELPPETVSQFLNEEGGRSSTGYKYWSRETLGANQNAVYNPDEACGKVAEHTRNFLESTMERLEEAAKNMKEAPISLYAQSCDFFGRSWHEGMQFIEKLFRMASGYRDLKFVCPSEYIFMQDITSLQVVTPEFSSGGVNGYAESYLDVTNDWTFRHLYRAMERMTELAERFPDDTGLKERALNQAAREILLAQSCDWHKVENSIRNFTTIYEALGSNYISTEWLTNLERRNNIFPEINYRVFHRKK